MPSLTRRGELRILQFESFDQEVVQAVFSRHGGVSPEPWASLNLGGTVGDDPQRVSENRQRAFTAVQRDPLSLYDVWQVHGVEVVIADAPRPPHAQHEQADIILTDKPGVTLMMRFADCVPILLHDPVRHVVGIAHAGWLGTVRGTGRAAVETMQFRYGCQPENIMAAIGPSIGPDHYVVGMDVINQVRQNFGQDANGLLGRRDGQVFFDLWAANRLLLEQAGVHQIECTEICTACSTGDWFSHRAEKGRTGRFGAMIGLRT
jgi:purine-nucleoside/S-methyl-5'-thioadenosine phosphorylase / adenosine deaminase